MLTKNEIIELVDLVPQVLFVSDLDSSYSFTRKIALGHYENFPVGSVALPKKIRKDVYAIYAFSRIADDIADESWNLTDTERIDLLDSLISNLKKVCDSQAYTQNPVFLSLAHTIRNHQLPLLPFEKLINAFKMDVLFVPPVDFDDLMNYCHYSACPIGELILRLFGEYNDNTSSKSDSITSALQLINFMQDISIDRKRGRNYLPESKTLKELHDFTQNILNLGIDLPRNIKNRRLKFELKLIINAGLKILGKIRLTGENLINNRPVLKKSDYLAIVMKSILW